MRLALALALVLVLVLPGCAPPAPSFTRHELAEQVIVSVAACMPFSLSLGIGVESVAVNALEEQLLLEADAITIGNGIFATRDELTCIAVAGSDCDAVLACVGLSVEPIVACPHFDHRCVGHTVVFCTADPRDRQQLVIRQDCATHGEVCLEGGTFSPQAQCASGTCAEDGTTCDGRVLSNCIAGRRFDRVCAEGTACDATAGACVGAGPECTSSTCDRNVLLECDPLSRRQTTPLDCSELGRRCDTFVAGCTLGEDHECLASEGTVCRDSVLRYCGLDGVHHTYACTAHGFAGCQGDTCTLSD